MSAPSVTAERPALLRVLAGERTVRPPLWLMRQAGRTLPEYREIRARAAGFMDFCYNPELAAEATLQPIRRFGFDAAILFSDILVIPDAMGQPVSFEAGEGPRLAPLETPEALVRLTPLDLGRLAPVLETARRVKAGLKREFGSTPLIGFCGAPWTVATYMIAGRGTKEQAPARGFAYRHPDAFQGLIDRLVEASVAYLCAQVEAGADAVQVFDSWAGVLPPEEFERWCHAPLRAIVRGVKARHPGVPVIAFPRGAGTHLEAVAKESGADAVGLDTVDDPLWAAAHVQRHKPVQGNLDPLALLAGGAALDRAVDAILAAFADGPHIFNLGHGILPETPLAHVEQLVKRVRG